MGCRSPSRKYTLNCTQKSYTKDNSLPLKDWGIIEFGRITKMDVFFFDEFQSNLLVMIISMETTTKKFAWYTFNCPYFTIFTLDSIRSSTVPGNTDWLICTKSIVSIFNTPLPTRPKAPTTCGMGSFMTIINHQKPFDCKHRKVHCGY